MATMFFWYVIYTIIFIFCIFIAIVIYIATRPKEGITAEINSAYVIDTRKSSEYGLFYIARRDPCKHNNQCIVLWCEPASYEMIFTGSSPKFTSDSKRVRPIVVQKTDFNLLREGERGKERRIHYIFDTKEGIYLGDINALNEELRLKNKLLNIKDNIISKMIEISNEDLTGEAMLERILSVIRLVKKEDKRDEGMLGESGDIKINTPKINIPFQKPRM